VTSRLLGYLYTVCPYDKVCREREREKEEEEGEGEGEGVRMTRYDELGRQPSSFGVTSRLWGMIRFAERRAAKPCGRLCSQDLTEGHQPSVRFAERRAAKPYRG
jgi:hypothetical protein